MALETLGRGQKQPGASVATGVSSASACAITLIWPYSFVPGGADNRSATSFCTVTHSEAHAGCSSRRIIINGLAME